MLCVAAVDSESKHIQLRVQRNASKPPPRSVLIIVIYKCVFLGKSLVESLTKDSGQNPIEPARLGCKILHGPNVSNFEDIYKYLETLKITKQINDSADLALAIIEYFKEDNIKNSKIVEKIENYHSEKYNFL